MADNPVNSAPIQVLAEEVSQRDGGTISPTAYGQLVILAAQIADGQVVTFDPRTIATTAKQDTAKAVFDNILTELGQKLEPSDIATLAKTDVGTTLTDGRKTSTTPGTAVPIVASSTPCKWVILTALITNTAQVNVGGSGVLATLGSTTGTPLTAGQSLTIPVDNANKVFVDVRNSSEGVSFTIGN